MANRKKEVYKPKPMTEGKRNLIQGLLQEYDIQSAEDIQDALKDLLSGTIQDMLETEMDDHLGYDRYERSGEPNYRNGMKSKTVRSKYGEFQVDVPQDRQSSFEPQILPKRQKDISSIDDKIISMYAKGMTTRQISETIEDIYGFEVSEGMVSDITDKLLPRIEEWQNRPLSPVYPIVFIDAVHFSVRDDGVIRKLAAYVVLGMNEDGMKEVLSIVVGENESSKYWLSVLNSLKNRGVQDIYGFEVSEGMVSDITDKLLPRIEEWQNRPLSPVYPIVFIDAVHFSVRDDGVIRKLAAYVVLGMNEDGMKEVLSIVVGENESSKYWLSVLNSLKNRGVQDILILCSDGLTGIKDAISTAFPKTEQQRCIVHMVRNTLKYVANKDMKAFAKDLKTIYTAADEEAARKQLESVTEKWSAQYPSAMNRWHENWDAISPIFKFSKEVRTAFYTTNAIESLNSCYRRLNKQRSVFPSSQALMKALYLGTFEIAKKWTMPIRNWGKVRGELEIMYPDRMLI